MAKTTTDTEVTIEALLEQRSQYEEWILRLDTSGDKASPAVRQRVRGDYEARLESVMEQLRGRGAAIAEELEQQHASQAELDRERRSAEEALAEAEVRHSVGEYSEEEWRRHSEQSKGGIEQLRTKLRAIGSEISRLTEIQGLIAGPRAAAAPPPPAPRAARPEVLEQAPTITHVADQPVEPTPPGARPRSQPEPAAVPVDEMAFLKSVSDDEPSRLSTRRPSNPGMPAVTTPATPRETSAPNPAAAAGGGGKAASGVAKTLKCGECGTLNRPTEWYCERCGAELAGV